MPLDLGGWWAQSRMGGLRTFLESSTIHGLSHISTTRKYARILWIIVVLTGFSGAGVLISKSFQDWSDSPVKTTIETLPITDITFPKVTVCPPKHTFTDLNVDLMMTENMTIEKHTRDGLTDYAVELLNDQVFHTIMKNLSMLEENNRYYNWYHGYSLIQTPGYTCSEYDGNLIKN